MPIDPSIPLQAQPSTRVQSPAELMGIVLAIQRGQQQQKQGEIQLQESQLEMQAKKRAMAAEDALNAAMSNALRPDGTIDMDRFGQAVAGTPAASKFPAVAKAMAEMQEQQGKVLEYRNKAAKSEADFAGSLANAADTYDDPNDKASVLVTGLASGRQSGIIPPDHVSTILSGMLDDAGNPDPAKVIATIKQLRAASEEQRKLGSEEATSASRVIDAQVNQQRAAAQIPGMEADSAMKQQEAAGMKGGLTPQQQQQASEAAQRIALAQQTEAREAGQAAARLKLAQQTEARQAAEQKASGGAKLSATAIDRVAGIEQSLKIAGSLESLVKDIWLGPIEGRITSGLINTPGIPISDDLARFAAETATLKNAVIKAITGAQMSEPEAARISKQIPDFSDKPNVWRQKLEATKDNLRTLRTRTLELSGQTVSSDAPTSETPRPRVYYDANGKPK